MNSGATSRIWEAAPLCVVSLGPTAIHLHQPFMYVYVDTVV